MPRSISTASTDAAPLLLALLRGANRRPRLFEHCAQAALAVPAIGLAWAAAGGFLGVNPLERLVREPGHWALVLLLATLTLTPLRHALSTLARAARWRGGKRLSDWNWLIRLRRPFGLASFFYASAHLALYATLDLGLDWRQLAADARGKPFIAAGAAAFALLLPLAITSTDSWMRRLKHDWKRLHRLVYPAAVIAALHYLWLSKPGVGAPYEFAAVLAVLLGYRLALRLRRGPEVAVPGPAGDEVPERSVPAPARVQFPAGEPAASRNQIGGLLSNGTPQTSGGARPGPVVADLRTSIRPCTESLTED